MADPIEHSLRASRPAGDFAEVSRRRASIVRMNCLERFEPDEFIGAPAQNPRDRGADERDRAIRFDHGDGIEAVLEEGTESFRAQGTGHDLSDSHPLLLLVDQ